MNKEEKPEKLGLLKRKLAEGTLKELVKLTKKMAEEQITEKQKINRERLIQVITKLMETSGTEIVDEREGKRKKVELKDLNKMTTLQLIEITHAAVREYAEIIGIPEQKLQEIMKG